jgi:glutaredoxin 2
MRLYLFEHCSICFRVRMAAALKRLHLQETVVLEDDSETMIALAGKRVVPILVKDDGRPMLESMAMVAYIDARKRKKLGDFVELRAKTREQIDALMPELETLDRLIESPTAVNGMLSLDDIRVLPLLRSAAVVKGLKFPHKVRAYFETMMSRIGYQPLPAI